MAAPPVSNLAFAHPIVIGAAFLLALVVFRQGLKQRDGRTKRLPVPPGNLKRHSTLGPWAVGLIVLGTIGGLLSATLVRGWSPLGSWHGRLGVLATALFCVEWWLGRRLLQQQKQLANTHGLLAVAAMGVGVITVLLGIEMLP